MYQFFYVSTLLSLIFVTGCQRAEVDVDYNDPIHIAVATNLVINFPKPRFAVLPVNLGVEILSFAGTVSRSTRLSIECGSIADAHGLLYQITMHLQPASLMLPPEESRQHLHLSLLPDFHLNVKASSLLGSRAKLQGTLHSALRLSSPSLSDWKHLPHQQIFQSLSKLLFLDSDKPFKIDTSGLVMSASTYLDWLLKASNRSS